MISRTFGQLKPAIAKVCGTTGMKITDPRIAIHTNEAVQELMNEGAWPGVVDRWKLLATDGSFSLPPQHDMVLEITVDGVVQQLMSNYAEFVNYGPGLQDDLLSHNYGAGCSSRRWWKCGGGDVFDRGESPVRVEVPVSSGSSCVCTDGSGGEWDGPWTIRQYASVDEEAGAYSTIQGLDPQGLMIRSQVSTGSGSEWINGVRLDISTGSGYFETTQAFSKITSYTKPSTNGYVKITAWNGVTEVELSNYEPWETEPSYRKYYSPFLQARRCDDNPCRRVILARVRRRFVPVVEDTDVMIISNINALKCMIIAQSKRDDGDYEAYSVQKLTAVDIMKKESVAYLGRVRTPAFTVQRGFSIGSLPALR